MRLIGVNKKTNLIVNGWDYSDYDNTAIVHYNGVKLVGTDEEKIANLKTALSLSDETNNIIK